MISNEEVELIRLKGYLEGLNIRLNNLTKIQASREGHYSSFSLIPEIKQVKAEIKEYELKISNHENDRI